MGLFEKMKIEHAVTPVVPYSLESSVASPVSIYSNHKYFGELIIATALDDVSHPVSEVLCLQILRKTKGRNVIHTQLLHLYSIKVPLQICFYTLL